MVTVGGRPATRSPRLRWVPTAGWFAAFVLLTGCVALGVTDGLDLRAFAWARLALAGAGGGWAVVDGAIESDAGVTSYDAKQSAVMHVFEQVRRRTRRSAPVVGDGPMGEVRVDVARVDSAVLANEGQQLVGSPPLRR